MVVDVYVHGAVPVSVAVYTPQEKIYSYCEFQTRTKVGIIWYRLVRHATKIMNSEEFVHISFGSMVGGFRIGSRINEVLALMANEYPRINMNVDLCPKEKNASADIHISIPEWGIRLRFQSLSQKMYLIDITNFEISYSLNGTVVSSDDNITLRGLQKTLGPSFPGM